MKTVLIPPACLLVCISAACAAPVFTQTDVFVSGQDGYHSYLIPALVTMPSGSLLAVVEGRRDNLGDPGEGDINLVYKTSADGGATWSDLAIFDDPGEKWSASNPSAVVDRVTGATWVLYNRWEPGYGTYESQPGKDHCQAWARVSMDSGATWSNAIDITTQARDYDAWGAIFFGPGGGIQAQDGRLLIPSAYKPGGSADLSLMRPYVVYSDDHGATWRRGEPLSARANENQLVERADGSILMDARQWNPDPLGRWRGISTDGGETWGARFPGEVVRAVCCSIERFTLESAGDDANRIVWCGPAGPGRSNLEVRVSYDEGITFLKHKSIYTGSASYSDMTVLADGSLGIMYDRDNYGKTTFVRLNQEWLEAAAPTKPPRPENVEGGPVIEGGSVPYAWYRADEVVAWNGDSTRAAWWTDVSGNNRHLDTAGTLRIDETGPNGKPSVVFPGGSHFFESKAAEWGIADAGTVFIVWRRTGQSDGHGTMFLYDGADVGHREFASVRYDSNPDTFEYGGCVYDGNWNNHYPPLEDTVGLGAWAVSSSSHVTGTEDTIRINGEEVYRGNLLAGGMTGLRLGGYIYGIRGWEGEILETIFFEGELSTAQREAIELTLMQRWEINVVPGDLNNDGFVGAADLDIVRAAWGQTAHAGSWAAGDPSGDGLVGSDDLDIVRANWGAGTPASVPEPGAAGVLLAGLLAVVFFHGRIVRMKASGIVVPLLGVIVLSSSALAAGIFTQTDVFTSGQEGYNSYRIPAIETMPNGTLVAFAEGRRDNLGDPGAGDINLVYKLSTDHGESWSALKVLDDPGEKWGVSNPTPVVDSTNGLTWVLYNRWQPGYGTVASQPGTDNCQAWARFSVDSGATWSDAIDITTQARDYAAWGAIFFGPGGGIQAQDGRLLIPSAYKPGGTGDLATMRPYVVYSDDHGATWQRGAAFNVSANENQLIELADETILIDARQWSGSNRYNAISANGGETWGAMFPGETVTAVACAIERFTLESAGDDANRILWSGPAGSGRANLEVRVSYDEGVNFTKRKSIYAGSAAYSDMTVLDDGSAGLLYERDGYGKITFARFNQEWLEAPEPVKPPRPDDVEGGPVVEGGTVPYAWYRADNVVAWDGDDTRAAWWTDVSGNNRHLESVGTVAINETGPNGKPSVVFPGGNNFMEGKVADWGFAEAGTVFTVWRRTGQSDGTGTMFLYDGAETGHREFFYVRYSANPDSIEVGGCVYDGNWNNHYAAVEDTVGLGNWAIASSTHTTGTEDTLRINGEEVAKGDLFSGGMNGLRLGGWILGGRGWEGDILESVFFEGELSTAERRTIELALMQRWEINVVPGDLNNDGLVGAADLDIVRAAWGRTAHAGSWAAGDPSGDGLVGSDDLDIVRANWGAKAAASVPEPSGFGWLFILGWCVRGKRGCRFGVFA